MQESPYAGIERLARNASKCRMCFEDASLGLRAPTIAIAQPRWIGPGYWESRTRVLIVMINPGSGDGRQDGADAEMYRRLIAFRDDPAATLASVFEHQRRDMPNWGRRRWLKYYVDGLGLNIQEIAFANIAWCATQGNRYPLKMLSNCFKKFTAPLIELLSPRSILLSGSSVHGYKSNIQVIAPNARVICLMNHAHREGKIAEQNELDRVRKMLTA